MGADMNDIIIVGGQPIPRTLAGAFGRLELDLTEMPQGNARTTRHAAQDLEFIRQSLNRIEGERDDLLASADVAAEYLEAQRVITAGPQRPESGFAPPRSWKHNDPEVIRWHKATAAMNALAAKAGGR